MNKNYYEMLRKIKANSEYSSETLNADIEEPEEIDETELPEDFEEEDLESKDAKLLSLIRLAREAVIDSYEEQNKLKEENARLKQQQQTKARPKSWTEFSQIAENQRKIEEGITVPKNANLKRSF